VTALVIGLGNRLRGDDGLGPAVAQRLVQVVDGEVDVIECSDPASLMDDWAGAERVVIVDAVASGRTPGAITVIDAIGSPLPGTGWALGGTHALSLPAVIELARALDRLPPRLHVVGVEMHVNATDGSELSSAGESAIEPAVEAVLRLLVRTSKLA
jgi:hydrogenase maturation protease